MRNIDRIKKLIKGRKVIAYGSGVTALVFLTEAAGENVEVEYLCDGNKDKQGKSLCGRDIRSPYDLLYEDAEKTAIVMCAPAGRDVIMNKLYTMGFSDENVIMYYSARNSADCMDAVLGPSRGSNTIVDMGGGSDAGSRILVLGGSTTDPTYEAMRSWSWYLQKILSDGGYDVQVLNGAVVGHTSAQELLCLLRDGIRKNPRAVISYTGYNDYAESMDLPSGGRFPFVNKNLYDYHEKLAAFFKENSDEKLLPVYYGERSEDAFGDFIYNARAMNALCAEFGIKYYLLFQPVIKNERIDKDSFAYELVHEELIRSGIERFEDFYAKFCEVKESYPYMYDFTGIFENEEDIFHDICHVSERGNEIIAKKVFELLVKDGTIKRGSRF